MNIKLQSYEEWLAHAGERQELGAKSLITYKLLQDAHKEAFEILFDITRDSFTKILFDSGVKPYTMVFNTEEDATIRVKELLTRIETYQGASLEDFAGMIYAQARDFYNQVKQWENKSLWQYLKWWFKRTLIKVEIR